MVPHHGSRTSSSAAFLDARGAAQSPSCRPATAAASATRRPTVLARYAARGITRAAQRPLWRLDLGRPGPGRVRARRPAALLASWALIPSRVRDRWPGPCNTRQATAPRSLPLSIHVALNHVTHYRYDRRVALSPQVVRLRPAPHCRTPILSYSLRVEPAEHFINWQQDPFANHLARLVFPENDDRVQGHGRPGGRDGGLQPVRLLPRAGGRDTSPSPTSRSWRTTWRRTWSQGELTPRFKAFVDSIAARPSSARSTSWSALNQRLQRDIRYLIRMEPGVQTPEQTLEQRRGLVPRHRLAAGAGAAPPGAGGALRLGLPDPAASPTSRRSTGPSGTEVDFTDLHAWCEVYLPGAGWVGLDPTSGLLAGEGHIPVACTPEPSTRGAGQRRGRRRARSSSRTTMSDHAHLRVAARHQALHRRRSGSAIAGAGRRRSTRELQRRTCA